MHSQDNDKTSRPLPAVQRSSADGTELINTLSAASNLEICTSDVTDPKTKEEEKDFKASRSASPSDLEINHKQAIINELNARTDNLKQDTELRKEFARAGYWMNVGWLILIFIVIILSGARCYGFSLPTSVLLALIGTTTANVLGVLYIVMRYLFNTKL